ncbi:AMP-binding protein [Mycolicibacterium helvum]|uniref:Acyl-CoA synthetase n=1 Tax=Mycolicibacterium helvum TaxID=1534349 RepID=A0A7I7T1I8_9MYCO|nr:AMP-binding protein [Mycolicibacterium helvum]BBY62381.1 acyl-CoA synthetase [Mycolicibacterium helvum]
MTSSARITCGQHERSVSAAQERAARIATALDSVGVGVGQGDRVAIVMRNEVAFIELTLAVSLLGAAPVPINWHWTGDDLAHALTDSGAKVAVVHSDLLPNVQERAGDDVIIVEAGVPMEVARAYGLQIPEITGELPLLEQWSTAPEPWSQPAQPAPMSVIYTSGTTGRAKGVLRNPIKDENRSAVVSTVAELFQLKPGGTTVIPAPLYHSAPNVHAMFALAMGMNVHLMAKFDAEELLQLIEEHRVDSLQVVPTMFNRLLQLSPHQRAAYDLSSLTAIVHAAAPCPPHVKAAIIDWLGPIVHEYYGGAEIGAFTACNSAEALSHPGTVGRPIGDADIRILDEEGVEVPDGTDGQIYGRCFTGWPDFTYIGDDAKRRAMERDGYLSLGDIGHFKDGYLYLSDRLNDMVVSGGVNIYPAEIEGVLLELDGVGDAAVFGIPDPDLGEVIAAYIEPTPDADLDAEEIRAHVAARLARYKVPREVVVVDSLPREDTGKLFKRRLREPYWRDAAELTATEAR